MTHLKTFKRPIIRNNYCCVDYSSEEQLSPVPLKGTKIQTPAIKLSIKELSSTPTKFIQVKKKNKRKRVSSRKKFRSKSPKREQPQKFHENSIELNNQNSQLLEQNSLFKLQKQPLKHLKIIEKNQEFFGKQICLEKQYHKVDLWHFYICIMNVTVLVPIGSLIDFKKVIQKIFQIFEIKESKQLSEQNKIALKIVISDKIVLRLRQIFGIYRERSRNRPLKGSTLLQEYEKLLYQQIQLYSNRISQKMFADGRKLI